jgi:hypothetical protein
MKRIHLVVTTDLVFDQRMLRIAHSLHKAGYQVTLTGRKKSKSASIPDLPFSTIRFRIRPQKGPFFYLLFNLRVFLWLLWQKTDIVSAADLDSLPSAWLAAKIKGKPLVFDAHELFTEVPELSERVFVKKIWLGIERFLIPRINAGYTVNHSLQKWYTEKYSVDFEVVRNVPTSSHAVVREQGNFVLYQGAVNAGRGLEWLVPACVRAQIPCIIAGHGDLFDELKGLCEKNGWGNFISFVGQLQPTELKLLTQKAWLGVNLLEAKSANYFFSLANKFFDYVQAGVPQLCMDFPEYSHLNQQFEVAYLTKGNNENAIYDQLVRISQDEEGYRRRAANCIIAAKQWNWELEEKKLVLIYESL